MKNAQKELVYSKELEKFINFAFDDLVEIAGKHPRLFEELYYNRKNQCDEFYSLMNDNHKKNQNVLIIGSAGVGKTSFMHKLLINCNKKKLFTIFVDYRRVVPKTKDGLLWYFIKEMDRYFNEIGCPIHTLKNNNNVDGNFQCTYDHLEGLNEEDISKKLTIFLDDFDYAEDEWSDLLKYFLPFSNSNRVSLVLSVRPPLLNAIEEYDDRFRLSYIRKARQIQLAPISVENVISTRLAPILVEREGDGKLYGVIKALFSRESQLCKLAREFGAIVDDLPRFEYPLTVRHNTFMQRITSGDLRETFAIAYESLKYIINHEKTLETKEEGGIKRKIIGREGVMKMLFENKDSLYKIINLHEHRSLKTGNSLYYNVSEAIKLCSTTDERFYHILSMLGHDKKKVDAAIESLGSIKFKFFVPTRLISEKHTKRNGTLIIKEYSPLPKLEMYLEMCNDWSEYIDRFGKPGNSVEQYL